MLRLQLSRLATVACAVAVTAVCLPPVAPPAAAAYSCPVTFMSGFGRDYVYATDRSGRFQAGLNRELTATYLLWWKDGTPARGPRIEGASVTGVNVDGTIVGSHPVEGTSRTAGWRYRQGAGIEDLPAPVADQSTVHTQASSINDDGWIGGSWTDLASRQVRPAIWRPDGTVASLRIPDGFAHGNVVAVDADGTPIGSVYNLGPTGNVTTRRTVVWTGPSFYPRLLSVPGTSQLVSYPRISDHRVAAVAESILRWDYPTATPQALPDTRVRWIYSLNAKGSILANVDGVHKLIRGTERIELEMASQPNTLDDNDNVYGEWNTMSSGTPVRWACG